MSSPGFLRRAVVGARAGPSRERAAFGALTSFAATVGISRTLNYVRERRRPFPRLRNLARRASSGPHQSDARVHHFLPGTVIAFAAGGTAILTHQRGFWLGVPYGAGVALTLDEFALLLGLDNPYWSNERLALAQRRRGRRRRRGADHPLSSPRRARPTPLDRHARLTTHRSRAHATSRQPRRTHPHSAPGSWCPDRLCAPTSAALGDL